MKIILGKVSEDTNALGGQLDGRVAIRIAVLVVCSDELDRTAFLHGSAFMETRNHSPFIIHPSSILFLAASTLCLTALPAPGLPAAGPERLASAATATAPNNQPIPWDDLGAKATAQYSGDGLAVFPAENGAVRLRCVFQRLAGEVTSDGLWLSSTVEGAAANRFRVVADYVGRDGGAMVALPRRGVAEGGPGVARYIRPGLVEEYSVSVDGVRQDFLVMGAPGGAGALRVELAVSGARAEAAADAVRLVLDGAERKLVYNRLRVVDAADRELKARLEVTSACRLAVVVDDQGAAYPVRIDPTFSDANWVSMGGLPGANDTIWAIARERQRPLCGWRLHRHRHGTGQPHR